MNRKSQLLCAAALSLALVSAPAMAASGVTLNEAAGTVHFSPNKAHGNATLVVSGPDGFHETRHFESGEPVSFSMLDAFDGSSMEPHHHFPDERLHARRDR